MTVIPIRHAEGESLRQSEADHAFNFMVLALIAFPVVTGFFAVGAWITQQPADVMSWGVVALLFLGALCILSFLFLGWSRGRQHIKDVIDQFVADANERREWDKQRRELEALRIKQEIELNWMRADKEAAVPPLLPPTTVPLTQNTDPKLPEMIGGFDVADIERLCEYFERGAKWSENQLIGVALPVTKEVLTPDRYKQLIDGVFVAKGVIGERDGDKRLTGKLLIKDAASMMKAIRPAPSDPKQTEFTGGQQQAVNGKPQ